MSFFGWGDAYLKTKNVITKMGGETVILAFEGSALSLEQGSNEIEAKSWQKGQLKTKRSAIGEVTYTLTMATQFANWQHLGFVLDEFASKTSGVVIPALKTANVPTATPFNVTDAAITAGNASLVKVQVSERGSWGEARYLAADEAAVAAGGITLDDIFAGAPISYTVPVPYSGTVETLGVNPAAERYGALELWFKVYGDADYPKGLWFNFPLITRKGLPNLNFSDSPVTFEMKFGAGVPSGANTPYRIYNPATNVLPTP